MFQTNRFIRRKKAQLKHLKSQLTLLALREPYPIHKFIFSKQNQRYYVAYHHGNITLYQEIPEKAASTQSINGCLADAKDVETALTICTWLPCPKEKN